MDIRKELWAQNPFAVVFIRKEGISYPTGLHEPSTTYRLRQLPYEANLNHFGGLIQTTTGTYPLRRSFVPL